MRQRGIILPIYTWLLNPKLENMWMTLGKLWVFNGTLEIVHATETATLKKKKKTLNTKLPINEDSIKGPFTLAKTKIYNKTWETFFWLVVRMCDHRLQCMP